MYFSLKYRVCENLNKISSVAFALTLGPNNDNNMHIDILFKPFFEQIQC